MAKSDRLGAEVKAAMEGRRKANQRGPGGRRICVCGCEREVPKGKLNWFGQQCIDRYRIQVDPGYLRHLVGKRDQGVCATCFLRTEEFRRQAMTMDYKVRDIIMNEFRSAGNSWWEADHIVEVRDGGKNELANMQTLCTRCHKIKTAANTRAHAEQRRNWLADFEAEFHTLDLTAMKATDRLASRAGDVLMEQFVKQERRKVNRDKPKVVLVSDGQLKRDLEHCFSRSNFDCAVILTDGSGVSGTSLPEISL